MLDRIKKMAGELGESALTLVQTTINPELKGVNAMSGMFAALVMADRICEPHELEMVADFMVDEVDIIQDVKMTREACELFLEHVKTLEKGYKEGPVQGAAAMGEILELIAEVKNNAKWREAIITMAKRVVPDGHTDKQELKTRDAILRRLAL